MRGSGVAGRGRGGRCRGEELREKREGMATPSSEALAVLRSAGLSILRLYPLHPLSVYEINHTVGMPYECSSLWILLDPTAFLTTNWPGERHRRPLVSVRLLILVVTGKYIDCSVFIRGIGPSPPLILFMFLFLGYFYLCRHATDLRPSARRHSLRRRPPRRPAR